MSRKALGRGLSALFPESAPPETGLLEIQIDLLDPSKTQPRTVFNREALDELAASIKSRGIIQPLVVRRSGQRFEIVAGERRWRAAQLAGLHKVPCVIREVQDDGMLEVSLIENIQRQELNAIEEAKAYRYLVNELGLTQEEVAQRVGKDRTSITNAMRLLKLPLEVQALVEEEKLSMGHARTLLSIEDLEKQTGLARLIVNKAMSVRQAEQLVKQALTSSARSSPASPTVDPERANVRAAESRLSSRLGAPVRIRATGRSGGVIEIKYSSPDDLSRLFDLLLRASRDA